MSLLLGGVALAIGGLFAISCGSSGGASGSGMGMATVSISDPATCAGPDGPYAHVYVTITDVQASTSATAGNSDSGWTDLTPKVAPQQIDLLGQANNKCFLATLGDAQQLQAGNYQQIRLILATPNTSVSNNACATVGSVNCVVLTADDSIHALQLSSEAQTGIKIPSGQIASGGFNIAAGQTKDLNIDFNTCASIVQEGNGQYRLKPVLHAGEVSTTSTSINGTVLDSATGQPVAGKVMVALEQKNSANVDRIVMTTTTTNGSFVFCPIPEGTYDVVVVGMSTSGTAYAPSIVTGVANGQTTGTVNLYAGTAGAATFTGMVTSQDSSNAGTVADVQLSALETDTASGSTFTIPLLPTATQTSSTLMVETAASSGTLSCPSGTDCADYSMEVPAGGLYIGVYATTGSTLTQSTALATYTIDGGTETCTPMEVKSAATALTGAGPFNIAISNALAFVACQ